jgi:RNA polymerase sigma-70 factor (ECF subfamily)
MSSLPPPASETTSTSLLERIKTHDAEAWRRFSALYGRVVYDWARQRKLQAEDASDIMQEVLGAVAKNIGAFRRDRDGASFRGWLWTITINKIRDHYRAAADRPEAVGGSEIRERLNQEPDPFSHDSDTNPPNAESALLRAAIEVARIEFEDRTWRLFWRVVVDQRSVDAVAAELGITKSAVYKAKNRVLKRVQEALADAEVP